MSFKRGLTTAVSASPWSDDMNVESSQDGHNWTDLGEWHCPIGPTNHSHTASMFTTGLLRWHPGILHKVRADWGPPLGCLGNGVSVVLLLSSPLRTLLASTEDDYGLKGLWGPDRCMQAREAGEAGGGAGTADHRRPSLPSQLQPSLKVERKFKTDTLSGSEKNPETQTYKINKNKHIFIK